MDRFSFLPSYHYEDFEGSPCVTIDRCAGEPLRQLEIEGSTIYHIPEEYQQVEYIEGSGSPYINTEVIFTVNIRAVYNYSYNFASNVWKVPIGVWVNSPATYFFAGARNDNYMTYGFSNKTYTMDTKFILGKKYKVDISKNGLYVDNVLINQEVGKNIPTNEYPIVIGRLYMQTGFDGTYSKAGCRIYDLKIYDNGILIREMIPCYRKSDNKTGMYDLVEDKFYENEGSAEFNLGEEVNTTPKAESILGKETVGEKTKNLYYGKNEVSYTGNKNYTDASFYDVFKEGVGKTYTLYCYVDNSNNTDSTAGFRMSVGHSGGWNYNFSTKKSAGLKGWVGAKFSIPENYNQALNMQFQGGNQVVHYSNFLLYEGEYDKGSTPDYEPYGYKIPVTVRGKNLLKYKGLDKIHTTLSAETNPISGLAGGQLYYGNGTGRFFELPSSYNYGENYVSWSDPNAGYRGPAYSAKVKPNTTYKYNHTDINGDRLTGVTVTVVEYNSDRLKIISYNLSRTKLYFTTSENTEYVIINLRGNDKNTVYTAYNIQLEEGDTTSNYEPYVESIATNIYLDEPLEKGEVISYTSDNMLKLPTFKGTTIYEIDTKLPPANVKIQAYKY